MKEIIYIQAGNFSNYVGTHFWNTQESYFTYEEDDVPYVDHDISFREGRTLKGESTFCPRLLLFDRKSNFGALGDGLYGQDEAEYDSMTSQWDGSVDEFRQPAVPKSKYQSRLDDDGDEQVGNEDEDATDIRYWSDYSRVFYHPRTPQKLPDIADYENTDGDWMLGREVFRQYNEETDLMDNSFRFFAEECDNLQGIQVLNDTTSFGSFTHSFLTAFRDDFTKLPCWNFPLLSDCVPGSIDVDNPKSIRKALNDALCLQGLNELSTLSIPLQAPSLWQRGLWLDGVDLKRNDHHISSILSTHIESITLPLRLKNSQDTLFSISSTLSIRGNQRLAHLSGIFPLRSGVRKFEERFYDFSLNTPKMGNPSQTSGCVDVSRGLTRPEKTAYSEWRSNWRPEPYCIDAPEVPLPSSFPRYFTTGTAPSPLSAISTLSTTSRTALLFHQYAKLADECTKQYADVVQQMGLEMDDVKELRDTFWALEDEYRGDDDDGLDGDVELGEDEE